MGKCKWQVAGNNYVPWARTMAATLKTIYFLLWFPSMTSMQHKRMIILYNNENV